jgi:hypothetical protein
MSDINPNRMIPLHIADQAVAACEKEIAALKAEVERLRASSFVTAVPVEQYERLREAGDAMVALLKDEGYQTEPDPEDESDQGMSQVVAWNAAKEGKPSV